MDENKAADRATLRIKRRLFTLQALKEKTLLQREEINLESAKNQKKPTWQLALTNPIIVSIGTAFAGLIAVLISEQVKLETNQVIEKLKLQNALIIDFASRSADEMQFRVNLTFLADSNLIPDHEVPIRNWLNINPTGPFPIGAEAFPIASPDDDWAIVSVRAHQALDIVRQREVDLADGCIALMGSGFLDHFAFAELKDAFRAKMDPAQNFIEEGELPIDTLTGNAAGLTTRLGSVLSGFAQRSEGQVALRGLVPELAFFPYRVSDSIILTPQRRRTALANAIDHAVSKNCEVIAVPMGTLDILPLLDDSIVKSIEKAYAAGIIVVASAGMFIDSVLYPASDPRTIAVGGTNVGRHAFFTYRHGQEMIDVWAPATSILHADFGRTETDEIDPFVQIVSSSGSGTSYSAMYVAAAAAMWLRLRANELASVYNEPWQRVEAFRHLLKSTSGNIVPHRERGAGGSLIMDALLLAPLPNTDILVRAE